MTSKRLCVGILVTLATAMPVSAGVEVFGDGPPVETLIYGSITDGSDPISWQPLGPLTSGTLLGNGGLPDVAWKLGTAYPVAVWAANGSPDRDIAFAEWDPVGMGWVLQYLTTSPTEENDPRVIVEPEGAIHVVWWRSTMLAQEVFWTRRPPGQTEWDEPVRVSADAERARRPSVAVVNGELYFAYERDSALPGMLQDVVVARPLPGGAFDRQVVHSTTRSERLDVVLHVYEGLLWADWKHAVGVFGCAELSAGQWTIRHVAWTDPTWVGVEGVRKEIRGYVIEP